MNEVKSLIDNLIEEADFYVESGNYRQANRISTVIQELRFPAVV